MSAVGGRPDASQTRLYLPLVTQSGHARINEGRSRLGYVRAPTPLTFSALSISLSITGSSIVAGMVQGRPSAIFFMVLRRTLPERVFGSLATVIASLKAATGPIFSRMRPMHSCSISATAGSRPPSAR